MCSITVHFDLGTIFEAFVPPEGDGIASLLSGKVNNLYAYKHAHTHIGFNGYLLCLKLGFGRIVDLLYEVIWRCSRVRL